MANVSVYLSENDEQLFRDAAKVLDAMNASTISALPLEELVYILAMQAASESMGKYMYMFKPMIQGLKDLLQKTTAPGADGSGEMKKDTDKLN